MKLLLIPAIFTLAGMATQASAVASLSPTCASQFSDLKVPEDSNGVEFDEQCTTAYVLPPLNGESKITSTLKNANVQFCPAVNNVQETNSLNAESMKKIAIRIAKMISDYSYMDSDLAKLRAKVPSLRQAEDDAKAKDDRAKSVLAAAEEDLKDANRDYQSCLDELLDPDDKSPCKNLLDTAGKLKTARNKARTASFDTEDALGIAKRELTRVNAEIIQKNTEYADALAPAYYLQTQLTNLTKSTNDLYKQYIVLEGLIAQVTYRVKWDKLVAAYRQSNPKYKINWTRMPIKNATLFGVTPNNTATILWSIIPGAQKVGAAVPAPQGSVQPLSNATPTPDIGQAAIGFSDAVSGQMGVSLLGMCQFYPKGKDSSPTLAEMNDLTAAMTANVDYTFEKKARRSYTATYNLSSMITVMQSNTIDKDWWSSSNIRDVVNNGDSRDWFSIVFDVDSSGFTHSADEQATITKEVKSQLVDRALKQFTYITGLQKGAADVPALPTPTGPSIYATRCYNNYWYGCDYYYQESQSPDATMSATSYFQSRNNVTVTDRVSGVQMIDFHTQLQFAPLQKIKEEAEKTSKEIAAAQ